MKITKVELTFPQKAFKFKAWAKIVIDDILMISGIRLFEDPNASSDINRYIRFPDCRPSLSVTKGQYVSIPIVNTVDESFRNEIISAVFDAYDKHPNNPANRKGEHRFERRGKRYDYRDNHEEYMEE